MYTPRGRAERALQGPIPLLRALLWDPSGGVTVIYTLMVGRLSRPRSPQARHTRARRLWRCAKWRVFGRRPRAPPAPCLALPMLPKNYVGHGSSKGGLHRHIDPPSWSLGGRYSVRRHAGAERYLALLRVHRIGARACVIALVPSRATPRRSRPSAVPMSFSCSGGE